MSDNKQQQQRGKPLTSGGEASAASRRRPDTTNSGSGAIPSSTSSVAGATTAAAAATGQGQRYGSAVGFPNANTATSFPMPGHSHPSLVPRMPHSLPPPPPPPPEYFGFDDLQVDLFGRPHGGTGEPQQQQQRVMDYNSFATSPSFYRSGPHDAFFPAAYGQSAPDFWEATPGDVSGYYDQSGKQYAIPSHHPASTAASSAYHPPQHHSHPHQPQFHTQQRQMLFHHAPPASATYGQYPGSSSSSLAYGTADHLQHYAEAPWDPEQQLTQHYAYGQALQQQHTATGPAKSKKVRATSTSAKPKKQRVTYSPIAGENRLKINFISYGVPGPVPQHFGTKGYLIPDGVSGTHEVYHQRWKFEIRHNLHGSDVLITWNIVNLGSGSLTTRTETPREARVRETSGHTICNQLLRLALRNRAVELEESLREMQDNPTKTANTQSLIKVLRPKSCILGLLFFGLLHETVQEKMREILASSGQSAAQAAPAIASSTDPPPPPPPPISTGDEARDGFDEEEQADGPPDGDDLGRGESKPDDGEDEPYQDGEEDEKASS